jgi:uncharacterized SAM-binding protein YcdF (DUF218 family)
LSLLKPSSKVLAAVVCFALLLTLTHTLWFRWLGEFLVHTDPLVKADAVLVLAGDMTGGRITKAAELVKQGYAPVVLVSGPMLLYGINEANLAINYAVGKGYPREMFVPMISKAFSTRDEVAFFVPELRSRGVHRLIIVSSDFHTNRAGKLFRKALGPDIDVHMIASPDLYFTPGGWWRNREGQKTFFFEWSKTISTIFGL